MLARLQQAISLALLIAVAAVLASGLRTGWHAWHAAALFLLLAGHAVVLGAELLLMRWLHRRTTGEAIAWGVLARAWVRETRFALRTFLWRQPWRSASPPDQLDTSSMRGRRGVVFVHGFVCNRGLWRPWLMKLRAMGVPFAAVNLAPVFGSIDAYPAIVDEAVLRVTQASGLAPIVVAHSMGGLATRAWLRAYDADDRVHAVITIGTPHGGTWLAGVGQGENARQMRRGNDWLRALGAAEPASRAARFTCWWSECDQIVLPVPSAVLPGSDARRLPGMAHVEMAGAPAVWDDLVARLRA
jgi:pimeloyl-ACP methyl ester carboxylesterase